MKILENDIRNVVKETVQQTLTTLGFDLTQVHETQADLLYLRKMRKGAAFLEEKVKVAVISASIPALLYLLWNSFKILMEI